MGDEQHKIYKDESIAGGNLILDRTPEADRPKPNALKRLILGIVSMAVDVTIIVLMVNSPESSKHGWKIENLDWYSIIVYFLLIITPVILLLLIEPALADLPTRRRRKKQEEQEMTRRKNYVRHLLGMVEDYEKSIFFALHERYLDITDIFTYLSRHHDSDWKKNRYGERAEEDFLTVRLGLGKVDITDHIIVPEPQGAEEREDELLWIARDVRQKFGIMDNVPRILRLGDEKVIGIACDGHKQGAYDIARIIIGQLELNEMSDRVQLAFAYDSVSDEGKWDGYDELYLSEAVDGEKYFASNADDSRRLFDRIVEELDRRKSDTGFYQNDRNEMTENRRHIVLFVSDPKLLEWHPINRYIQPGSDRLGLTVIVLYDDSEKFITGTSCEIISRNNFAGLHKPGKGDWIDIQFDKVTDDMIHRLDKIVRQ